MLNSMRFVCIALCCVVWGTTAAAWAEPPDAGAPASPKAEAPRLRPPDPQPQVDDSKGRATRIDKYVLFESEQSHIRSSHIPLLEEVARVLRARPDIKRVRIEGHADSSEQYALEISRRRARHVRAYLVLLGVEPGRLLPVAFGSRCPLAESDSPDDRAKNRNVTVEIIQQDGETLEAPRCRDAKSEQGLAFNPR